MYNKRIKFIILSMRNLYLKIIIHRRNYMENKGKVREHGITLVALVITIIILLILAGVAITALTQTGLFEKAKEAKNATENAQIEEKNILDYYNNKINSTVTISNREKSNNDYSLEEKVIGTWIDGKKVYRRTYTGNINKSDYMTIAEIENLDLFLGIDTQASYIMGNNNFQRTITTLYGFIIRNENKIQLTYNGTSCFSIGDSYAITVQYTKTND